VQTGDAGLIDALSRLGADVELCPENLTYIELESRLSDEDIVFWEKIPPRGFYASKGSVVIIASADAKVDEFSSARAGAHGFISPTIPDAVLSNVIACVSKGEIWMTRDTIARVFDDYAKLMKIEIFSYK